MELRGPSFFVLPFSSLSVSAQLVPRHLTTPTAHHTVVGTYSTKVVIEMTITQYVYSKYGAVYSAPAIHPRQFEYPDLACYSRFVNPDSSP